MKFTAEWSKESVSFLDTTVKLEDGQLVTDQLSQQTPTNILLPTAAIQDTARKPYPTAKPSG